MERGLGPPEDFAVASLGLLSPKGWWSPFGGMLDANYSEGTGAGLRKKAF